MNYNVYFKGHTPVSGGSCRECLTYTNMDRQKQNGLERTNLEQTW